MDLLFATPHENVILFLFFVAIAAGFVDAIAGGGGLIIGSYAGSHLVISNGDKIVRPVFITVCLLMTTKLLYEGLRNSGIFSQIAAYF
jgi:uncharacterized membrane protein YfcA